MSTLFGCICNQPTRLLRALTPLKSALQIEGVKRWGYGYVESGQVLLSKHPRAVEESFDFLEAVSEVRSDYLVGHAESDSSISRNSNTQPFRFQHWMFAQEGSVEDFDQIEASLKAALPGFLQRNIQGHSPAEYLFHSFLAFLHDTGQINNYNLPLEQSVQALRASLRLFQREMDTAGIASSLGNICISNARSMLFARLDGPVFMRHTKQLDDEKRPDTEFRSIALCSSSTSPGEGFEEIPERHLVAIHRDLRSDILPIAPTANDTAES